MCLLQSVHSCCHSILVFCYSLQWQWTVTERCSTCRTWCMKVVRPTQHYLCWPGTMYRDPSLQDSSAQRQRSLVFVSLCLLHCRWSQLQIASFVMFYNVACHIITFRILDLERLFFGVLLVLFLFCSVPLWGLWHYLGFIEATVSAEPVLLVYGQIFLTEIFCIYILYVCLSVRWKVGNG